MAKPDAPLVYVDTCVYFDLLSPNREPHPDTGEPRSKIAAALFTAATDDRIRLAASALLSAEIACTAVVRDGGPEVVKRIQSWLGAPTTVWTEIDLFLAHQAADIARTWHPFRADTKKKMGGADALHLAAAVELGCDYFMTHDEGFPLGHTVDNVHVLRPTIVWPSYLTDGI